ncbi:MAG: CopD family protein [Candidatus Rokuibacteriota bacterium]
MAGFADVLLRGLALSAQAMAIGGVVFFLALLRPLHRARPPQGAASSRALSLVAAGALVVAGAQVLQALVQAWALSDEAGWPLGALAATAWVRAAALRVAACAALVIGARLARRDGPVGPVVLVIAAVGLAAATAWTSHAAGRLGPRALPLALDGLHQVAGAVWVGGLAHLLLLARSARAGWPASTLKRFSAIALVSVGVLVAAGAGLSLVYMDGPAALLATAYGAMVLTKAAILVPMLALGAANFLAVRAMPAAAEIGAPTLRRFVEVELGLGITVLFVAASLTSLPPAVDVRASDRATLSEVATIFTPRPPRLVSPPHSELPFDDREAPRTDADRAWSEYNHHVAGLFVLGMGALAILDCTRRARWARHWPLVFAGLAAFLLVRNDPGAWPLGLQGFWEGFRYPEVVQHRFFVLLALAFAFFEWRVRALRLVGGPALVFPILCVLGGALLLTHSHASLNLKAELLTEITHIPLGLFAIATGWGRWLELRLPALQGAWPGRLWPWAFALVGLVLVLYRES